MSEIIKCEKCGAVMRPIDPSKPVGMTCPNCGWGWATTYVDPMLDDNTIYKVSLSNGNKASKSAIKAVAKVSGKNFIQAKRMIENSPSDIYEGKAIQVKEILILLESLPLSYSVMPEFPYSLSSRVNSQEDS